MKKLKVFTSILLTLVLCLSFAMPALAVESNRNEKNYSITVDNANPGHKYEAYQVFSADYTQKNGNDVLSNIEWGNAIVREAEGEKAAYDHSAELIAELKKVEYFKDLADNASAETVVMTLNTQSAEKGEDVILAFSKTVGDFLIKKDLEKTVSGSYNENTSEYVISSLRPGYYVVVDATMDEGLEAGDAYSRYMVKVAGNARVTVKSVAPTLDKTTDANYITNYEELDDAKLAEYEKAGRLLKNEDGSYIMKDGKYAVIDFKNGTATTGDKIGYKLTSVVPDMTGYTTYKFNVTDKLSKGLKFNKDIKVTIGETVYTPTTSYTGDDFAIVYSEVPGTGADEGKTIVTIEFKNMKKVGQPKGTPITITYSATLTNEADVIVDHYRNEAYLTYSNDPKGDGEGTTPPGGPGDTDIWSVGIRFRKFGIENGEEVPLAGAQFLVYDKEESDDSRKVLGIMISKVDGTVSIKEATKTTTADGTDVYTIEEGAKDIILGEGTFYLREIKAPEGYNLLKGELKLTLKATTTTVDGVTKVTWTPSIEALNKNDESLIGARQDYVTVGKDEEGNDIKIAVISLNIQNKAGFQLPSTGGVGTVIFTVVGILVMAAVVVIAVKSNKKK